MTEPIRRNVDANGVNLNVYVLDGYGCMVHFDEPDRLAAAVKNFLRRTL